MTIKDKVRISMYTATAVLLASLAVFAYVNNERQRDFFLANQQQALDELKLSAVGSVSSSSVDGQAWWNLVTKAKLCVDESLKESSSSGSVVEDPICVEQDVAGKRYVAVIGTAVLQHSANPDRWSVVGAHWKLAYYYIESGGAFRIDHRYEGGGAEYLDPQSDWVPLLIIPDGELAKIKEHLKI